MKNIKAFILPFLFIFVVQFHASGTNIFEQKGTQQWNIKLEIQLDT